MGRFLRTLADLPDPPVTPPQLTVGHLAAYQQRRLVTTAESNAWLEMRTDSSVLMLSSPAETFPRDAVDFAGQRVEGLVHHRPQPGYSDAELRRLIGAARTDVARLRDRLDAGEHLLRGDNVAPLSADDPQVAPCLLEAMAATGVSPLPEQTAGNLASGVSGWVVTAGGVVGALTVTGGLLLSMTRRGRSNKGSFRRRVRNRWSARRTRRNARPASHLWAEE